MNRVDRCKEILWVISMFGLVAIVIRLAGGLGASTGLSDAMPWGIWKIINMVAGVALATGGFALAAIVYIFSLKKYHSLLKPAILVAFLGYGSSVFALVLDIGLPHRIWHPLFHWNHHSFLFEVAMCVMFYFTVTIIELAPVILEKFRYEKIVSILHAITIPLVIVGITLSSMHHTSLGSLFLVMPHRLHDLWFSSLIPVHFILSALGAGMMSIILVSLIYSFLYNKQEDKPALFGLSRIAAVVLGLAFIVNIADLTIGHGPGIIFNSSWEGILFQLEMLLSFVAPIVLISLPSTRNTMGGISWAASSAVLGLVLNRTNVGILGILRSSELSYFPSFVEITMSLGILAAAALVFLFVVENFSVFENARARRYVMVSSMEPVIERLTHAWSGGLLTHHVRISLLIVIAIPLASGLFYSRVISGFPRQDTPVKPPLAIDDQRHLLKINGDGDEDFVIFKHEQHKKNQAEAQMLNQTADTSCRVCHHLSLPNDKSTPCSRCHTDMFQASSIFNHGYHEMKVTTNQTCGECHDLSQPKTAATAKDCAACHEKDMGMPRPAEGTFQYLAHSYVDAFHLQCIECHRDTAAQRSKPEMAECSFCHRTSPAANAASVPEEIANRF